MADNRMMAQMSSKDGFIAALDQSGGSTPGALRLYGIPDLEAMADTLRDCSLRERSRRRVLPVENM